ncbi:MAG: DNA polymerase beta [Clostridiaceae bacterium BRH_c20a]|nr:MAG: DNA polymerase beta [Clostridiaceae bacterium BRH_c20a]
MDLQESVRIYLQKQPEIVFAYLFGSYIKGSLGPDSDIDIAIYIDSPNLKIEKYLEIKNGLTDICERDVDLVILNEAQPLIKYKVYQDGVILFSRSPKLLSNFQVRTLFEYEDIKNYLTLSYKKMIERTRKEVAGNGR